ncbi:MAG: hypothetical protein QM783_13840 [Phycisphaerales bacterium]
MRYAVSTVCAAAALVSAAASLNAAVQTFEANWSGPNGATAVATFDLDLNFFNAFNNPGGPSSSGPIPLPALGVSNMTLTVTGAASGNGTWTTGDFIGMYMYTNLPINPMIEWVGQPQVNSGVWGTFDYTDPSTYSDFNVFVNGGPIGFGPYTFTTNGGAGEAMYLTSVHPVPTPAAAAMLGLGGVASLRRRRRRR